MEIQIHKTIEIPSGIYCLSRIDDTCAQIAMRPGEKTVCGEFRQPLSWGEGYARCIVKCNECLLLTAEAARR